MATRRLLLGVLLGRQDIYLTDLGTRGMDSIFARNIPPHRTFPLYYSYIRSGMYVGEDGRTANQSSMGYVWSSARIDAARSRFLWISSAYFAPSRDRTVQTGLSVRAKKFYTSLLSSLLPLYKERELWNDFEQLFLGKHCSFKLANCATVIFLAAVAECVDR